MVISRKAAILGGLGAVAGLFQTVLQKAGVLVTLVDSLPAPPVARDAYLRQDLDSTWTPEFERTIRESDLVIVALPEPAALRAAPKILGHMRKDSLWVDTLSVKGEICELLAAKPAEPSERVSINPMFAPRLGFTGQSVAWVDVLAGTRSEELKALLITAGAKVQVIGASDHDRLTAATQVATHAAVLAFGLAIRDLGYDAESVWRMATPPHRILASMLARIVAANPDVYWDIQRQHSHAVQVRAALTAAVESLDSLVARDGRQDFHETIDTLRALLQPVRIELADLGDRLVSVTTLRD